LQVIGSDYQNVLMLGELTATSMPFQGTLTPGQAVYQQFYTTKYAQLGVNAPPQPHRPYAIEIVDDLTGNFALADYSQNGSLFFLSIDPGYYCLRIRNLMPQPTPYSFQLSTIPAGYFTTPTMTGAQFVTLMDLGNLSNNLYYKPRFIWMQQHPNPGDLPPLNLTAGHVYTLRDWVGYPDFLVRTGSDPSKSIEPEDAKLSRKAKGEYLLQLGIYAELLEASFEIPVQGGAIHVAAGDPESFDLRRTRYILKRLMRGFERFVADEGRVTKPQPCAACGQCDYKSRCEEEWRTADSPFFVAGLSGAQVVKLAAAGVQTLSQLAALSSNTRIDGMGTETVAKLSAQARLQLNAKTRGKHGFELLPTSRERGFGMLPAPDDGDLFFDMEGDPLTGEGLEYLFGIFGRPDGGSHASFRAVWAHKAINKLLSEVEKRAADSAFRFSGAKKGNKDDLDTEFISRNIKTIFDSVEAAPQHRLVGGTVFHFCRDDQRATYDYLFVDEAGQVSLGNLVAMAGAAANLVLVGDQMQLPQPVQGVHPGETGLSSLDYLLEGKATVPDDRGILLNETRRLHPTLCTFISEAIYDGRLKAHPTTADRYLVLRPGAHAALRSAGLSFVPVAHDGCTQSSRPEAEAVAKLVVEACSQWVFRDGKQAPITLCGGRTLVGNKTCRQWDVDR
jgi:hypothetical protein